MVAIVDATEKEAIKVALSRKTVMQRIKTAIKYTQHFFKRRLFKPF